MSDGRGLTWRGKLLMAVLSPLVFFGLIEVALRIGGFRYEPWKAHLAGKTYDQLRQRELFEPDPDLLWTLRKSTVLDAPEFGFEKVATNSLGLRGKELPGPKEPGEFRVLCLGDSVTFCYGLRDGDTWPERMEEALAADPALAGKRARVVNGAVPGWSSVQGARLFDRIGDRVDPDVVVFWFGLPDSHEMYDLPDRAQMLPVTGLPKAMAVLWKLRVFQLVEKGVTAARRSRAEGTRVSRAEFRANVERFVRLGRSGGPRPIFVHEPEQCETTIAQLRAVVEGAKAAGAEIILAPRRLFVWIIPAPRGADLVGRPCRHEGRPAILFPPNPAYADYARVDAVARLEDVERDLENLEALKRSLDRTLAELPPDALGHRELFGDADPEQVFLDNCHLTPFGARLAGAALARKALSLR